jgi:CDI immunity protein
MTDVVKRAHWCRAIANGDFICIETWSGYRGGTSRDPKGAQHFLRPDAGHHDLGDAIIDALAHSRFVLGARRPGFVYPPDVEFDMELSDYDESAKRYAAWIEDLKARYRYKTKRALFRDMKNCGIESRSGQITVRPTRHEKLEGWVGTGMGHEDHVVLPADSSADKLGEALRLAFSRCL